MNISTEDRRTLLSTLAFATIASIAFFFVSRRKKDKSRCIPPLPLRSAGAILQNFFSTSVPTFLLEMIREVGNPPAIRLPLGFPGVPLFVIVNDHRTARIILDDPASTKWALAYQFFDLIVGGDNMLASEGSRAKHPRKATALAFSPDNVRRMADIMGSVVDEWIQQVLEPKYVEQGRPIDIAEEMTKLTCDAILQAAFDYKLPEEEREALSANLKIAEAEFSQRSQLNPFRKLWLTGWMFSEVRQARRATRELVRMSKRMLLQHRAKKNPKENTIIYMMDKNHDYRNDNELIRDLLTYVLGGFGSTSHALAWMFLELARHADEQTKLREALRSCTNEEEKYNHKALKHVIREAMRLRTVSSLGSLRVTASDIAIPGSSIVIPAKSACMMPYFVIHRNASCYPNPDVFDPSRWETPSDDMLQGYLPFACGRRNCQGQALANAKMQTILAKLVDKYEFSVVDEGRTEFNVVLRLDGALLKVSRVEK